MPVAQGISMKQAQKAGFLLGGAFANSFPPIPPLGRAKVRPLSKALCSAPAGMPRRPGGRGAGRKTHDQQRRVMRVSMVVALFATFLGLVLAAAMTVALIRPVRRLLAGTNSVEAGALDIKIPVTSSDEIGRLTAAFNKMVRE